jgi:hypothetical protein
MRPKKLTLSVDERVIEKARRYSRDHKTSISRLVTQFLDNLPDREQPLDPAVERLIGILPADVDIADYHRHLEEKHGL